MGNIYKINYDTPAVVRQQLPDMMRNAHWQEVAKHIRVSCVDFINQTPEIIRVEGVPVLSITVFLEGTGRMKIDGGRDVQITPGNIALFYSPRASIGEHQLDLNTHFRCVDFRFELDFIQQLHQSSLDKLAYRFGEDHSVRDVQLAIRPTTIALNAIAQDVLACDMTGLARDIYMQAKALEAFSHVMENSACEQLQFSFNQRDKKLIEKAAQLLSTQYSKAWTIQLLAKAVGINEKKLKQGFRHLLGCTIHTYLEKTRLEKAKKLLARGIKVTEVTLSVGYTSPSHFAKVFRHEYGFSPSEWRKRS